MESLKISNKELDNKSVIEYLNEKYDVVEHMRGLTYTLNNVFTVVLTDEDERMLEIVRKSFFRCLYSGKLEFDKSPIIDKINQYLEINKDIDSEKYFKKRNLRDCNYTYNIVNDRINDYLSSRRYELMELLF